MCKFHWNQLGDWYLEYITLKWMPEDLVGHESTLVQVMAWCRRHSFDSGCVLALYSSKPLHGTAIFLSNWLAVKLLFSLICQAIKPVYLLTVLITNCSQDFETWTKWLPFWRQHFQVHCRDSYCIKICSHGFNWQWVNFNSGNGLTPNSWQSITWSNVAQDLWCHMVWFFVSIAGHFEMPYTIVRDGIEKSLKAKFHLLKRHIRQIEKQRGKWLPSWATCRWMIYLCPTRYKMASF